MAFIENELEAILHEDLSRLEASLKIGDPHSANYWLLEYIKDINKFTGFVSKENLIIYAKIYTNYKNLIEKMLIGDN